MKESLNYYYNFNIAEVEVWDNVYRFQIGRDYFYFVPFNRLETELDDIVAVSTELKMRGIEVHDIIFNRFGKIITNVYNTNYVLLRILGDIYEEY
ncbi:MAG: hypothetical protein K2J20_05615, partial [Bacilli bacterium]|nr:hypothetical protein [Bacilli bacterium]